MQKLVVAAAAAFALACTSAASAAVWSTPVGVNVVADQPIAGGGYPVPAGTNAPTGTCRPGLYNSNRSESWIAAKPGTENLVGVSKLFFENFSTYYDFHLGAYAIQSGAVVGSTQVQGYDCVSTGSSDSPPSWTNNTDPNVDFDTKGRAYQITLPFNAYWVNLHPNGAIGASYSDDLGLHWVTGNGGKYLDKLPNSSSLSFGDVVDKQWVAVNHFVANRYQDHVYAMWSVFNGSTTKIRVAVSRDRGQTFTRAATLTAPQAVGPSNTYVYPSVDAAGDVYVAFASFPPSHNSSAAIYVARSTDDAQTWGPFVKVVDGLETVDAFPNTRFRDGILENFTASPSYPGHVYLTWEQWDGTQMDVAFSQSTDYGLTWSDPAIVNDNVDGATPTDQFQPSVAAGPGGAVAIAFYDRRQACPSDPSILPADRGRDNFCIDTSLQAYKDEGTAAGAVPVDSNVRMSQFTWDPEQPGQRVDGLSQYPCAAHTDPCPTGGGFIGDYFGLAISGGNIYGFFVSTHYPSPVVQADGGGPVYYQDQVLSIVPRTVFGSGY